MIKQKILICLVIISLFFIACEDSVNPNADFRERNVLTGVINPDTNLFVVTLSRSYEIDGLDPLENTVDPAIHEADVKVWFEDRVVQLFEDTKIRVDRSRYKNDVSFYSSDDVKPSPGSFVEIEALLKNGLLLKSRTQIPDTLKRGGFQNTDINVPPLADPDELFLIWTKEEGIFYHPRLFIRYYDSQLENSGLLKKEIPLNYSGDSGTNKPVFANPSLRNNYSISMETIDRAMREVSGDNPAKENYFILRIDLEVMVYDKNLSAYFSSISNFLSDFTILVNQPDYTNIEGGFGIFGAYSLSKLKIEVDEDYINLFGYKKAFQGDE